MLRAILSRATELVKGPADGDWREVADPGSGILRVAVSSKEMNRGAPGA
jgi:hypothetical protein